MGGKINMMGEGINPRIWTLSLLFVGLSVFVIAKDSHGHEPFYQLKVLKPQEVNNIINAEGDEDEVVASTTQAPVSGETNLTNSEECENTGDCCFEYTWPGNQYDSGLSTNFTCSWYIKYMHATNNPCHEPAVFTYANITPRRRPDVQALIDFADAHNYRIYCRRGQSSHCIKYSFFTNDNGGVLLNETRYCGRVQSVNTNGLITNGCYKEKILGFTKEVCVCSGDRCNLGVALIGSNLFLPLFAIIPWMAQVLLGKLH